jgi:hypothetical protein
MRRVAVIGVVLVFALMAGACSSSEDDALGVVESAYSTFSEGNLEGWVEVRDTGSCSGTEADLDSALEYMRSQVGPLMDEGARYEDISCESQGYGEWPGADEGLDVPVGCYSCSGWKPPESSAASSSSGWSRTVR